MRIGFEEGNTNEVATCHWKTWKMVLFECKHVLSFVQTRNESNLEGRVSGGILKHPLCTCGQESSDFSCSGVFVGKVAREEADEQVDREK